MLFHLVCQGNVTLCINFDSTPLAYLEILIETLLNTYVMLMNVLCSAKESYSSIVPSK